MTKKELLRRVRMFSCLSEEELDTVARYCRFYRFGKGEVIYDQGSAGEELFIIDRGEVHITKTDRGGHARDVAHFLPGESFGELDLLGGEPRQSAAVALEETRLLIFPMRGVRFHDILERHPHIFARVLHQLLAMIASRIRSTNRLISESTPWVRGLRKQLLSDPLTGLYNRTYLEEEAELGAGPAGLLLLKPDNFKQVNDTCGHQAGDQVLRMLAGVVSGWCVGGEAVRYRGDEFAVLLPGASPEIAARRAGELKEEVEGTSLPPVAGSISGLTASIGVACYPSEAPDREELISLAVQRMLEARNRGGSRIVGPSRIGERA
jgi:diguanylate cyclase (GGDEF)-like protein